MRVGAQGAFRHETHGLLAVVIEHAWARAVSADATPDPQLHTHVVVANMAKSCEDECEWWRTLDMQPVLREWKRAAPDALGIAAAGGCWDPGQVRTAHST